MSESRHLHISDFEWSLWNRANRLLPHSQQADNLLTLAWFLRWHKRMPVKGRRMFNDVLYEIKTSGELVSPLRVKTTDKALVKEYVLEKVGAQYNVPTIAVLHSVEECEKFDFPSRCVIKPTHMSGPVMLRTNGQDIDRSKFRRWFATNYYHQTRERNYKSLVPKVIVEEFALGLDAPLDYKILCADGKPGLIQVHRDRFGAHGKNLYDVEWNLLPFEVLRANTKDAIPKPGNLAEMLEVASKLSRDFSFVRVDLYSDGKGIVVGELTHMPANLRAHFHPRSGEAIASRLLFGNV